MKKSPLAPAGFPAMPPVDGVRLATASCGIKYKGRTDLCLIAFDPGSSIAGVLTSSKTASAPVEWCRSAIANGAARALLVNSGNANAFTGRSGHEAVRGSVAMVAKAARCRRGDVMVASTGVIGEPLAARKFAGVVGRLAETAAKSGWEAAADAITTTDTATIDANGLLTRQSRTLDSGDDDLGIPPGTRIFAIDYTAPMIVGEVGERPTP